MTATDLLPILDKFLEAAATAGKWRALADDFRTTTRAVGATFTNQGKMLRKRTDAQAREARRLVPGDGLYAPLREAALSQADWLDTWDTVAVDTETEFVTIIQAAASAGMQAGAAEIIKELQVGTAFNLRNPRAVQYLEDHGAELVRGVNRTTRDRLRTIIAEGASEGASYTEIANRIDLEFTSFSRASVTDILLDHKGWSRAETVAIQELSIAYEHGNSVVVADLAAGGLEMQKSWLTVGDDRVDPDICAANQGQGWIAYEDSFQSAHLNAPGHVLCRCSTLYRRKPRG